MAKTRQMGGIWEVNESQNLLKKKKVSLNLFISFNKFIETTFSDTYLDHNLHIIYYFKNKKI